MEPTPGIKAWQWVVTAIVIIVLIIIGIIVFGGSKGSTPSETSSSPSVSQTPATGLNLITMTDQYPGNVVYLSSVQVAQPSWVVIQTDNNGQPGTVIGSAHFDAGINPGKITLTQPTVEGGTYYAVLYTDDGSGTFTPATDVPLKDANNNIIMHIFHASASVGAGMKE